MINPSFHVNKLFKEKVQKCMKNKFGKLTQPLIKNTSSKKYKCVSINNVS